MSHDSTLPESERPDQTDATTEGREPEAKATPAASAAPPPEAPQVSPPPPDPWAEAQNYFEAPSAWGGGMPGGGMPAMPPEDQEGMPELPYEPDEADGDLQIGWHGGTPEMRNDVRETLRTIYDPEIPVNIYDLGLIYRVALDESGGCQVEMTLTAPGCPVAGPLVEEVEQKVQMIPAVTVGRAVLVFDPPWTMDKMAEAARLQLGMF